MPVQRSGKAGDRGAMGGPGGPGGPGGVSYGNGNGKGINGDRNVIIVAMGALSVLGTVVWWAMTTQMAQMLHQIEVNKTDAQHLIELARSEAIHAADVIKADSTSTYTRIEEVKRIDSQITDIKNRLTRMSDQAITSDKSLAERYLTKDAYLGQHNALIDQLNRLQDRHNELRTDVAKIITPGDTIKEILDRLKLLESKIYASQAPKKTNE